MAVTGKNRNFFRFSPEADITTFELALIIARLQLRCSEEMLAKLSPNCRRHFERADTVEIIATEMHDDE